MQSKTYNLTNSDKLRIFALYIGSLIKYKDRLYILKGVDEEGVFITGHNSVIPFNECKLQLKEVRCLTEQDIFILCKYVNEDIFGDYRFNHWTITPDPDNSNNWKAVLVKNRSSEYFYVVDLIDGDVYIYEKEYMEKEYSCRTIQQWYFFNNYAVQLYPWKRNAIELGLADFIESKKLISQ